jgi:hypothetical protein
MKDSSYFGEVNGLTVFDNNTILCVDSKSNKVNFLSFNLAPKKSFGNFGKGPGELNYPMKIWTNANGIFVYDMSGMLKHYNKEGTFIKQITLPVKMFGERFTGVENNIFFGAFGKTGPDAQFNIDTGEFKEFGEFESTKNGDRSYALSSNIVQISNHFVYAINTARASINVFDQNGDIISQIKVPEIEAIQRRLEFARNLYIQSNYSPQISVDCIDDAYISNRHL